MELKNDFLSNGNIKSALEKLYKANFDAQTSYNIKRIIYHFDKNVVRLQKEFMEVAKGHAELDEKGQMVPADKPGSFKLKPDQIEAYGNAISELMAKTFEMPKCNKIPFQSIEDSFDCKLSAQDISGLEPILDGVPALDEETKA